MESKVFRRYLINRLNKVSVKKISDVLNFKHQTRIYLSFLTRSQIENKELYFDL